MTVTKNGRCWNDRFLQTCKVCHLPEAHTQWLDESRYPMKQQELISFNATWDKSWEPFYISSRNVPLFDERFKQYGFDRIEQICELHIAGYKFPVLNNAFLVHDVSTWILLKFTHFFSKITQNLRAGKSNMKTIEKLKHFKI